ncbi:SusC/RagA family TonB-linked outer membrane protein [Pedobacter fastidiosus]|uniref:SusC/RagA family TonB-linked outer membrane protein n=1 Tax=Pedobacter fastidiosus TaxID=2765361 RepID=A0ABR7KML7_9SPHI|nr:SusC/RagA family TonB-linked outer membrane protein [Pedobacter fastidiosus]MBC6109228.1 SusC/RagA family TonB-linked outer membrane protein [Pedobacter fastidiosus]
MNLKFLRKISLSLLVMLLVSTVLFAQDRKVTGKVVDQSDGTGIPGVNVSLKGIPSNVSTNADGVFTIQVKSNTDVLVFSYIGYVRQQVTVGTQSNINVKLVSDNKNLDDVVIVGYGTQKKGSLTGSISTIELKKVEDIPALNLTSALRGTAPGLSVSGGSQRPGQGTTITIRNPVAFAKDGGQGTNPLFVIDDIIRTQADFDALDINEVESATVLKDAEAAIYGVQGANGVIIVRTKRGKQGAPKINFSTSLGTSNATILPKMMNSSQLGNFLNDYTQASAYIQTIPGTPVNNYYNADGFLVTGATGAIASTRNPVWYTPDELAYFADHSHNYLEEAFNTAYVFRSALNVSGGNDKVIYFLGGDYVNQNSNFKGINSYKYGLRASVEAKPAKGLTTSLALNTNINYSRSYWYKLTSTSESLDNDAASLQNIQPWQEYFIDGNPVVIGGSNTGGNDNINFFQIQNSNNYTGGSSTSTNILGKITYEIPGIKGLTATGTMNKNLNSANNKQFGTTFTYYKYAGTGANAHIPGGTLLATYKVINGDKVRLTPTFANSYQLDAGLNYDRSFGKHNISAVALFEQRETNSEGVAAESTGVVTGGLDYQTFTTGAQSSSQSSMVSQFGFQSFISRLNYDYDNKYLVQLIYRADGSSRFAPGRNWGSFPAVSAGWVASKESFIADNFKWVDLLKFRVSVGLTGTDNTRPYQYQANYNLGTGTSGGAVFNEGDRGIAIRPNVAIPNEFVTWDHVLKTNYGVDMAFLKNRLSFSGEYYWNKGYDLLTTLSSSVPATIGGTVPTENYSRVNMFGYEFSLGWRDHIGKDFTYSFSPFYTWMDNKNIKIDVSSGIAGTVQDLSGQSSDAGVLGYRSLGIIRTQADADALIAQRAAAAGGAQNVKIFGQALQPGMINYEDVNGDGIISTDTKDQSYITKRQSNHNSLGLNFSVGYKGFNMNVIMGMSWGGWTAIDGL